jgi:hypothetical protein
MRNQSRKKFFKDLKEQKKDLVYLQAFNKRINRSIPFSIVSTLKTEFMLWTIENKKHHA